LASFTFTTTAASDDIYSCNIDDASEAQVVDAVQTINYSVVELVCSIMDDIKQYNMLAHDGQDSEGIMNAARGLGCESHPVHVMSLQNSQTDI
jgi:hypothetical protein